MVRRGGYFMRENELWNQYLGRNCWALVAGRESTWEFPNESA